MKKLLVGLATLVMGACASPDSLKPKDSTSVPKRKLSDFSSFVECKKNSFTLYSKVHDTVLKYEQKGTDQDGFPVEACTLESQNSRLRDYHCDRKGDRAAFFTNLAPITTPLYVVWQGSQANQVLRTLYGIMKYDQAKQLWKAGNCRVDYSVLPKKK